MHRNYFFTETLKLKLKFSELSLQIAILASFLVTDEVRPTVHTADMFTGWRLSTLCAQKHKSRYSQNMTPEKH